MLLLVILSIIPKLPLFLFWNPNFTQISNQKKKKKQSWSWRRISLHFMLFPRQLQETQEKNHRTGSSGPSFFSFPPNFNQPTTK